jgi:hypothetical protein
VISLAVLTHTFGPVAVTHVMSWLVARFRVHSMFYLIVRPVLQQTFIIRGHFLDSRFRRCAAPGKMAIAGR